MKDFFIKTKSKVVGFFKSLWNFLKKAVSVIFNLAVAAVMVVVNVVISLTIIAIFIAMIAAFLVVYPFISIAKNLIITFKNSVDLWKNGHKVIAVITFLINAFFSVLTLIMLLTGFTIVGSMIFGIYLLIIDVIFGYLENKFSK